MNYWINKGLGHNLVSLKHVVVIARFAAAHKSRILIPSALCEPSPVPAWIPLKLSWAFPTWSFKSPHTNKYSSGETVEMLQSKALWNKSSLNKWSTSLECVDNEDVYSHFTHQDMIRHYAVSHSNYRNYFINQVFVKQNTNTSKIWIVRTFHEDIHNLHILHTDVVAGWQSG